MHRAMLRDTGKIFIIDVTNRDGAQTARISMSKLARTMINLFLDEMGVFQSELGFPTLNHEKKYINANLKLVQKGVIKCLRLQGWCRALKEDVDQSFSNCPDLKHISLSAPTSDIMIKSKFQGKKNWDTIVEDMVSALKAAIRYGVLTVGVNAEDASRTDLERLLEFAQAAKENGASRLRYSDTLGLEDPFTMREKIEIIVTTIRIPVEIHCHNDLGMAVAVSVAGAMSASRKGMDAFINTTINGYGERSGNCDLVSALLALRFSPFLKQSCILDEKLDLTKARKISHYASHVTGIPLPLNQPGTGSNIFTHESGIHVDGTLKNPRNYELFTPEHLGRGKPDSFETGRMITIGEYSGLSGLRHVYEKLGIHFYSKSNARSILELVQCASIHTQKSLTSDELIFIAHYPEIARDIVC